MIPSSNRRTWVFILLSSLAFWGPGLVAPSSLQHQPNYLLLSSAYQSLLVIAGFWFGPAICRAMVVGEVTAGPGYEAIRRIADDLGRTTRRLPITLFEHQHPFVLTAGMLPAQCEIFITTELVRHLGPSGLRFQIARAMVHGTVLQRTVALVPVLLLTVLFPDSFDWASTANLAIFLVAWLVVHWLSELLVDRQAARMLGADALTGLGELLTATGDLAGKFSLHPPAQWRMRAISSWSK